MLRRTVDSTSEDSANEASTLGWAALVPSLIVLTMSADVLQLPPTPSTTRVNIRVKAPRRSPSQSPAAHTSGDAHPVEVILLASPLPRDCIQALATASERVAVGAPHNLCCTAMEGKSDQVRRVSMTPRRPGSIDMQAVRATWQQMVRGPLLIDPVSAECHKLASCLREPPIFFGPAKPVDRPESLGSPRGRHGSYSVTRHVLACSAPRSRRWPDQKMLLQTTVERARMEE